MCHQHCTKWFLLETSLLLLYSVKSYFIYLPPWQIFFSWYDCSERCCDTLKYIMITSNTRMQSNISHFLSKPICLYCIGDSLYSAYIVSCVGYLQHLNWIRTSSVTDLLYFRDTLLTATSLIAFATLCITYWFWHYHS